MYIPKFCPILKEVSQYMFICCVNCQFSCERLSHQIVLVNGTDLDQDVIVLSHMYGHP